jgi:hypothetical protein
MGAAALLALAMAAPAFTLYFTGALAVGAWRGGQRAMAATFAASGGYIAYVLADAILAAGGR